MSLLVMGLMVSAQTFDIKAFAADTLSDGDTTTLTSDAVYGLWNYSMQVVADELSGTSTMTGLLQFSNDNTNWTTSSSADTLSLTDDGSTLWVGTMRELYVRVQVIQTGTATASILGTLILKKPIIVN